MKNIKLLFAIVFSVSTFTTYGQNCSDYHVDNCRWADESFLYCRQSKSALFRAEMESEFSITVYGGEEYYISIKGDHKLGKIRVRIKEDDAEKAVLYNNAHYNYEDYFYFKNENTRNLIIEVTSEAISKFNKSTERYCVGVLIQFRNYKDDPTNTGF